MSGGRKEPGGGGLASEMSWAVVSANVLALLALVLAVAGLVLHFTDEDGGGGAAAAKPTTTAQASPAAQATPTPVVVAGVSVDDDPSIGPEDAAVTIVGFTDYQ
jgi:protein-disulfide isomerase